MGCRTTERVIHFQGTLPAAGAFTDQPFYVFPACTDCVSFWITYTSNGPPAGFPTFRLEYENGVETDVRTLVWDDASLVVAQPEGTVNVYLENVNGPAPLDATPIVYLLPVDVPCGATGVRLLAAEGGAPATPGDLTIALLSARDC